MNPTTPASSAATPLQQLDDPFLATVPQFPAREPSTPLPEPGISPSRTNPVPVVDDAELLEPAAWVVAAERDRMAVNLGDGLVNQMFAVSLDLHTALSLLGGSHATGAGAPAAQKIRLAIARLDEAVKGVRATFFDLRSP
jgi:signal transduction histidine kinase